MTTTRSTASVDPGKILDDMTPDIKVDVEEELRTFFDAIDLPGIVSKIKSEKLSADQAIGLVTHRSERRSLEERATRAEGILKKCRKVLRQSGVYDMESYKDAHLPDNVRELVTHYRETSIEDTDPGGTPQTMWRRAVQSVRHAVTSH